MTPLLLAKLETPADAASAETRYQLDVLRAEAAAVWPGVEVRPCRPGGALGETGGRDVLLVGTGAVLATRRSLAAMADARRAGAPAVVPYGLGEALRPGEPMPHTLRGFEAVEARVLAGGVPGEVPATSLLPLALVGGEAAARGLSPLPGDGGAAPAPREAVRAGLCYGFGDYYGLVREDVVPLLPAGAADVLDVGCGTGATGALLQQRLGCRVTGVELNPAAAAVAATRLHRVVCGDVADAPLGGGYDAVLALDVFEHLADGEAVLRRLATLVRPGGRIVLSVPNVGHHAVVTDLLAGRWDYLAMGLHCYTHLRFFTRRTLADWLARLGFTRVELVPQPSDPPPPALAALPGLAVDRESLATLGFWVLVDL